VQVVALCWAGPLSKESYRLCKRLRNCKAAKVRKGSRAIERGEGGVSKECKKQRCDTRHDVMVWQYIDKIDGKLVSVDL
jgi:hypothetical protein